MYNIEKLLLYNVLQYFIYSNAWCIYVLCIIGTDRVISGWEKMLKRIPCN